MEHRAEPRFLVSSPIRVIVPGNPARILNCDLIDVSATGMRFISSETVPADEIVAVEVDSRLVLAEIRYCQPRGDKFVSGVRRLHEIAKGAELTDSGACATEMIWNLRRHISAGGERDSKALAMKALEEIVGRGEVSAEVPEPSRVQTPPPEPIPAQNNVQAPAITIPSVPKTDELPRQEPVAAVPIYEMPLEAAAIDESPVAEAAAPTPIDVLEGDYTDAPASAVPAASGSAEIESREPVVAVPIDKSPLEEPARTIPTEVLERHETVAPVPEVRAANESPEIKPRAPLEAAAIGEAPREKPAGTIPTEVLERHETGAPVPEVQATAGSAEIKPQEPVVAKLPVIVAAAKVPVKVLIPSVTDAVAADPLSAARSAVQSSAGASDGSGRPSRSWRVPLGIAAGLVLAGVIGFNLMQRRTQANSPDPAIAVEAAKVAPPPVAAAPSVPPAPVPSPIETPAKTVAAHHAQIKVLQASWISIAVDGGKAAQTVLHKGDTRELDFSQKAFLWLGNAPGVEITLDNAAIGPLKGTVRMVQLTPHGVEYPNYPPQSPK